MQPYIVPHARTGVGVLVAGNRSVSGDAEHRTALSAERIGQCPARGRAWIYYYPRPFAHFMTYTLLIQ